MMKSEEADPNHPSSNPRGGGPVYEHSDTDSAPNSHHSNSYQQDPRHAPPPHSQRPYPYRPSPPIPYTAHSGQTTPQHQSYAPPPATHQYSPRPPSDPRALPRPSPQQQPGHGPPVVLPQVSSVSQDSKPAGAHSHHPSNALNGHSRPSDHQQSPHDHGRPPSRSGPGFIPGQHMQNPPPQVPPGGHPGIPHTMYDHPHHNGNGHHHYPQDPHPSYAASPMAQTHPSYVSPITSQPSYWGQQNKKKSVRAQQACNQCRTRKQKCDEQRPCQFCRENGHACEYKDIPPPKTDRSIQNIMEKLAAIQDAIQERSDLIQESVDRRLNLLENVTFGKVAPPEDNMRQIKTSPKDDKDGLSINSDELCQSKTPPRDAKDDLNTNLDEHRTAAHHLLQSWPGTQKYFHNVVKIDDNYPMTLEEARGSLRIYGRGEGLTYNDRAQQVGSPPHSEGDSDDLYTPTSSSTSETGNAQPNSFPSQKLKELDFTPMVVRRLYDSYLENMHVLHPFLDKARLKKQIDTFIEKANGHTHNTKSPLPIPQHISDRPQKKRRTDSEYPNGEATSLPIYERSSHGRYKPEGTITNAIILLVLALGEVLNEDGAFRSVLSTGQGAAESMRSPSSRSNHSATASTGLQSPIEDSPHYPKESQVNMDVVPGLQYYALASDILGNMHGGNEVYHAQAFLLASLYINQLGRGLESYSWINSAARVIRVNVKSNKLYIQPRSMTGPECPRFPENLSRDAAAKFDIKMDLLKFAYWSAVQLESDILAELSLPQSHITDWESRVDLPTGVHDEIVHCAPGSDQQRNITLYSAQIQLRKILNLVHTRIYPENQTMTPGKLVAGTYKPNQSSELLGILVWLYGWRESTVLPKLNWDDGEDPSTNFNTARLRGKYYGAETVITRPYLQYVVHCEESDQHMLKRAWVYINSLPFKLTSQRITDLVSREAFEELPNDSSNSRDGIDLNAIITMVMSHTNMLASIRSTKAFNGIGTRLKVTNIFGTVHAQFGNCLVLAQCSEAWFKYLEGFAPLGEVSLLLEQTMLKCRKYAHLAPALGKDERILKNALNCVRNTQHPSIGNRSYSSPVVPMEPPPRRASGYSTSAHSSFG